MKLVSTMRATALHKSALRGVLTLTKTTESVKKPATMKAASLTGRTAKPAARGVSTLI